MTYYKPRIRKRPWGAWDMLAPTGVVFSCDTWEEAILLGNFTAYMWKDRQEVEAELDRVGDELEQQFKVDIAEANRGPWWRWW